MVTRTRLSVTFILMYISCIVKDRHCYLCCLVVCYLCCSVVICVVLCIFCLCKCVLPPGDNPVAVNKYIILTCIIAEDLVRTAQ